MSYLCNITPKINLISIKIGMSWVRISTSSSELVLKSWYYLNRVDLAIFLLLPLPQRKSHFPIKRIEIFCFNGVNICFVSGCQE